MEAAAAGDLGWVGPGDRMPRGGDRRGGGVHVHDEGGMSLGGRAKVGFDTDVQFTVRTATSGNPEPAAAPGSEQRRLRQLRPAEDSGVEGALPVLRSCGAADLNVMDHVTIVPVE